MHGQLIENVKFGSQEVGLKKQPLILPDIDMFFNGKLDIAEQLILAVKTSGLKAIKTAIIEDPEIVFDDGFEEEYLNKDGSAGKQNYRELIHKKILTREEHKNLFSMIRSANLELVVSIYELESIEFAVSQGAIALKIPSSNITFRTLIEEASRSHLPIIIDTGKSTLFEIYRAISWAKLAGAGNNIIVQHSPMAPPAPIARQDLSMIPYLREVLGLHVGLSHHARGPLMALASVALGASLVEFGFCRDNEEDDQDVFHAITESELPTLIKDCNNIFQSLGDPHNLFRNEIPFHQARMSLRAKIDISEGTDITLENTSFSFPPIGIGAEYWLEVKGKSLNKFIEAGQPIKLSDLNW